VTGITATACSDRGARDNIKQLYLTPPGADFQHRRYYCAQKGGTMWQEKCGKGKYKYTERYKDIMTGKWKKVSLIMTSSNSKTAYTALQTKIKAKMASACDSSKVTLDELIEAYRKSQRATVKNSTWRRNEWQEKKLSEIIGGDVLVNKLTASFVKQKLLDTKENGTRLNQRLKTFKAMMRWGYKNDKIVSVEWMAKLESFPEPTEKEKDFMKYLEKDELSAVLDAMSEKPVWQLLTKFQALSGLRIGETIALDRSDVDIDARLIHVTKTYDMVNCELTHSTKTETSTRDVRIRPELMPVILDINKMMTKRHIVCSHFITDSTDYLSYDSFRQYLGDKTLQTVGRRLTPHALRHTFVSLAAASGLPLDVITRQVGHASEEITQIYLHATEMMKEKDNARLDAVSFLG